MYEENQKPYLGNIQFGGIGDVSHGHLGVAAQSYIAEHTVRDKAKADVALDELKTTVATVNQLAAELQKRLCRVLAPDSPVNKASGAVAKASGGPLTSDLYAMADQLRGGISTLRDTIERLEV